MILSLVILNKLILQESKLKVSERNSEWKKINQNRKTEETSPDLLSEISQRNKLVKRHKRHPTSTSWVDYKRQRNKVTSLKRNALKMFCCDAFEEK